MIRINLLPHREEKKKQRRREFGLMAGLVAMFGVLVIVIVGQFIEGMINSQVSRNTFIEAENKKLDEQIKEIATLRQEIEALKARQKAVEDLQSDRNLPTILLEELVRLTPEGIYLRTLKQEGLKYSLTGIAQSNERVSEFLRALTSSSEWLRTPELQEIKLPTTQSRTPSRLYEFSLSFDMRRPAPDTGKPGAPGTTPPAAAGTPAAAPAAAPTR
jgi:type IV pilus assembly protein PilN